MATAATAPPAASIREVVLTCDLLRFSVSPHGYRNAQAGNLRWLSAVLGAATDWPRMGVRVRTCGPANSLAQLRGQLRSSKVLRDYESDSDHAWAARYEAAPQEVYPQWLDDLMTADLVVGFELPPGLKRALHERGRSYISFHIHALRFLRDLCLGASTNHKGLARRLQACAIPEAEVQARVRRFSAQIHKHAVAAFELPTGWPLLIGQTARDSILIDRGRFAQWEDFEARLGLLLEPYPGCVLLEHPLRSDSIDIAQLLRARFSKPVVMTNANGYGVLFHGHSIPTAITLASSLGVEASALGIPSQFLLGDPRDRVRIDGIDVGVTEALGHRVLAADFWRGLFEAPNGPPARRRVAEPGPFVLGDNFLRGGLEAWSYTQLKEGLIKARARKALLPTEAMEPEAERALCGHLNGASIPVQGWSTPPGRAEGDRGVDLFVGGRPLGLGDTKPIDVSDPYAPLLLEGFHARENWGAWSARPESRVRIAVAPTAVAARARLHLRLSLRMFEGLLPRHPVCRIVQNGHTLALLFFRPSQPANAEIECDAAALSEWCNLDLHVSDVDSPNRTLGHPDRRPLGVALRSIVVQVLESDPQVTWPALSPTLWGVSAPQGEASTATPETP